MLWQWLSDRGVGCWGARWDVRDAGGTSGCDIRGKNGTVGAEPGAATGAFGGRMEGEGERGSDRDVVEMAGKRKLMIRQRRGDGNDAT